MLDVENEHNEEFDQLDFKNKTHGGMLTNGVQSISQNPPDTRTDIPKHIDYVQYTTEELPYESYLRENMKRQRNVIYILLIIVTIMVCLILFTFMYYRYLNTVIQPKRFIKFGAYTFFDNSVQYQIVQTLLGLVSYSNIKFFVIKMFIVGLTVAAMLVFFKNKVEKIEVF